MPFNVRDYLSLILLSPRRAFFLKKRRDLGASQLAEVESLVDKVEAWAELDLKAGTERTVTCMRLDFDPIRSSYRQARASATTRPRSSALPLYPPPCGRTRPLAFTSRPTLRACLRRGGLY